MRRISPPKMSANRATSAARRRDAAAERVNARRERIILVSNRGPIEHQLDASGRPEATRGAGGVVSGLLAAAHGRPVTWVALAMTDADRGAAAEAPDGIMHAPAGMKRLDLHLVDVAARAYRRYYDRISNGVLWFAQHYLLQPGAPGLFGAHAADDWQQGYRQVNQDVADAVIAELEAHGTQTPVLFQDYHLYLAPAMVRERVPEAHLAHFVHIPWPESRYWEMLPEYMVRAIFRGLAANDCISFQTQRDANNFLAGALRVLRGAQRIYEARGATRTYDAKGAFAAFRWRERTIRVAVHAIALDRARVRASARSAEATAQARAIASDLHLDDNHRLIVRVDRVEPTKNIVRGFLAYERLLKLHPELREHVTFLALLVPSRESLAAYRTYAAQVDRAIARINAQYGTSTWQPIVAYVDNDQARALACMRRYDVLLVNPIIDGMNLVVKEGGLVNSRQGVVVLSRTAGAYEQLGPATVNIAPTDIPGTTDALYQALTMSQRERRHRASAIRAVLRGESATQWLDGQLDDLARATHGNGPAPAGVATRQPAATARGRDVAGSNVTPLRTRGELGALQAR